MFTSQEEIVLRRIVQENTPLSRPIIDHGKTHNPVSGDYLTRELARCTPIHTVNPEEDYAVINKLRDAAVLKHGERLMEFFARTGLGRAQLLAMSIKEIQNFVRQAEANNAADGFQPQVFAGEQLRPAPRPAPARISVIG